jgi:hypothetical protein
MFPSSSGTQVSSQDSGTNNRQSSTPEAVSVAAWTLTTI